MGENDTDEEPEDLLVGYDARDPSAMEIYRSRPIRTTDYNSYGVGSTAMSGKKIGELLGRGPNYVVYKPNVGWLTRRSILSFEFSDPLPICLAPALREFREVATQARTTLPPRPYDHAIRLLAAGLNSAMNSQGGDDLGGCFSQARAFIETTSTERSRSGYLLYCLVAASILVAGMVTLFYFGVPGMIGVPENVFLGAVGGILGTSISVLQRGQAKRFSPFSSTGHLGFDAGVRMILGALFGGLVVVLSLADLAFVILKENLYALFVAAIGGGFSERLIPDLIDRISRESSGGEDDDGDHV